MDIDDEGSTTSATATLTWLEERLHGSTDPKEVGALGERYAQEWLRTRGWSPLDRNWRTRYGELDLVMLTPERIIVFVEVKTRRNTHFGTPEEAVTAHKRLRLRRACVQWLTTPDHRVSHAGVRCDVVCLTVTAERVRLLHLPEAF